MSPRHHRARTWATLLALGPLTLVGPAIAHPDDARTTFLEAARDLLASAAQGTPTQTARARGALSRLEGTMDAAELASLPKARAQMAWLEAAAGAELAPGADPELARAAVRRGLERLAEARPGHPEVILDQRIAAVIAGDASVETLPSGRLTHRLFPHDPDAVCDRLLAGDPTLAAALLDHATPGERGTVVAAILAHPEAIASDGVTERLDGLDHGSTGIGPTVIRELARRGAGSRIAAYVAAHPESATLPGTRVVAIAGVARTDPGAALDLAGGESIVDRLPGRAQSAIRIALAGGHASRNELDEALTAIELAGQLDDRILAMIAGRIPSDEPARTLDGPKSLQTLAPGRLVSALAAGQVSRQEAVTAVTDLFLTGRDELAYTLLTPNTTDRDRPADQWLPQRIGILNAAMVAADASPDAWIPLLEALPRVAGVDGQIACLADLAEGLDTVLDGRDLPAPVRAVFSDALVEIALRG